MVILAEDNYIRDKLAEHGIHVQTIADVAPIEVQPARVLSHLYTYLGRNKKLGLSGRKSRDVGILSTSKLYSLKDRIFAFTPQVRSDSPWPRGQTSPAQINPLLQEEVCTRFGSSNYFPHNF